MKFRPEGRNVLGAPGFAGFCYKNVAPAGFWTDLFPFGSFRSLRPPGIPASFLIAVPSKFSLPVPFGLQMSKTMKSNQFGPDFLPFGPFRSLRPPEFPASFFYSRSLSFYYPFPVFDPICSQFFYSRSFWVWASFFFGFLAVGTVGVH